MKIAIGSDHAGLQLKQAVIEHLKDREVEVTDLGTYEKSSCHYPIYAQKVARAILNKQADLGILVCGTGVGMSIAANKVHGIRAAAVSDCFTAAATRRHNDANILCLGERVTGEGLACLIVDAFILTEFEGGRHQTRVDMIADIEKQWE
mgnify:CR=1 FL=1